MGGGVNNSQICTLLLFSPDRNDAWALKLYIEIMEKNN